MATTISSDSVVKRFISGTGVERPAFAGLVGTAALWMHSADGTQIPGAIIFGRSFLMELTGRVTTLMALASFVFVGAIIVGMI